MDSPPSELFTHFAGAGNVKSPQGQKEDQIFRDNPENTVTVTVQYSALNPACMSFSLTLGFELRDAESCKDLVPLLFFSS